jgi:ABC-type nickel/cobalt efflux system permease component RcnA
MSLLLGIARLGSLVALSAFLVLSCNGRAPAHPLGNFTINHLAVLQPEGGKLRVHYVLDIAEIPTFQIMHVTGEWSPARMRAWEVDESSVVSSSFSLRANGNALPLRLRAMSAHTRPGAGGLPTLYWTGDFTAALPLSSTIAVQDRVYADRRIGWKDLILPGLVDPTNALRNYPNALIGSPRHNDAATFDVLADGRIARVHVSGDGSSGWGAASLVRTSALSDLFSRDRQTPLLVLLTVLAAFGLGALHGLEPGHGKALLAFTLVGARATFKQAVVLAAALTFAHTIAVLLLGLLLFVAAGFATESLFAWITVISGAAVAAIGALSLSSAVGRRLHEREHEDAHHRGMAHEHVHEGAHAHSHAIPGSAPLHFRGAVIAAMSGGIAPCPAAIVVLLTALHLHRVGYGLLLIVIFSLGLAAILTGLGIAVVHGAAWLQRRSGYAVVARFAPFLTSSVISIIGAIMLAQGLTDWGLRVSTFAVVGVTLLAIAAFALIPVSLSPRSAHRTLVTKEFT